MTPEQHLMQAVIAQAFADALRPIIAITGGAFSYMRNVNIKINRETRIARAWLLSGDNDFCTVVCGAGFDPEHISEQAIKAARRGWTADFPIAA